MPPLLLQQKIPFDPELKILHPETLPKLWEKLGMSARCRRNQHADYQSKNLMTLLWYMKQFINWKILFDFEGMQEGESAISKLPMRFRNW